MLQLVPQLLMAGRAYDIAAGSPTTSTITLSFLYVPGARSYEYSLSTTSAVAGFGSWTALASDKIITGLSSSTQYWIRVRAVNGVARGPASPVVTSTTTGASFTTLNGSDKAGTITLTGSDLIMTGSGAGSARSIANHATGIYFCEMTAGAGVNAYDHAMCVANASASLTNGPGSPDTNSAALYSGDSIIYVAGSSSGVNVGTYTSGDVVGMYTNRTLNIVSYRINGGNWNGNVANDPTVGGADISAITGSLYAMGYVGAASAANTLNFGASAYGTAKPGDASNW